MSSSSSNSLNNAHHFISVKLTSKSYIFWKTQLLPFLRGQNLQGFIDRSKQCSPAVLSIEVIGLKPSKDIWDTLAVALSSPSKTSDFNIYVSKGLREDFKDIVTTLSARPEPVSHSELLSLLLNHGFINGSSMTSLSLIPGDSSNPPAANIAQRAFNNGDRQNTGHITNSNNTYKGRNRAYRAEGDEVVVINTRVMPTEIIILILLNLGIAMVMDVHDDKSAMELITKLPLAFNATITV
ncbi:hypothetical protein BC332_19078 [Capsicum chinense]|nr:hypothetical protein BC332_19078 [Capsicum chinense]